MVNFAVALNIVLTTAKVPHEIAEVHKIQLIFEEKFQVFAKRRTYYGFHIAATVYFDAVTFYVRPTFIRIDMIFVRAVHTREQHHKTLVHFVTAVFVTRYRV